MFLLALGEVPVLLRRLAGLEVRIVHEALELGFRLGIERLAVAAGAARGQRLDKASAA